jgi:hypothetical protein
MTGQDENATQIGLTTSALERHEPAPEGSENQKIERLSELGKIVHGLRNSANSILSATEYLIEDAGKVLTEDQLTLLRGAARSSLSILRMLENVTDVPRTCLNHAALT